ncbi:DISARM system helicase DrmA, partial [Armatimonas sp.]|uniref:DISARM system helicase DrmA n=1 Tax=Armatimonas sp. TaxID=1872638 RepID=UPI003750FDF5
VYREIKALEMLYRQREEFAVGHGTAVHADVDPTNLHRATRVATSALPTFEVAPVEPALLPGLLLDMKELARTPDDQLAARLAPLVTSYADWIATQTLKAAGLTGFDETAKQALAACEQARQRILEGLTLLTTDPQAAEAFRFTNRAMWLQRVHVLYAEAKRQGKAVEVKDLDIEKNRSWRPFQLAFILLNLPGITKLDHPDRSDDSTATADLLWFPTGGGKTEAYLGLTAYTLGLRRLQGVIEGRSSEHGVAVLMRYTLRLLTLQQFQRASALICACEAIRRDAADKGDIKWGSWPFRIGLWVGNKTTPNTTEQAEQAVLDRRDRKFTAGLGDPAQLTTCPWCGTVIEPGKHLKVEKARGRTLTYCGDATGRCMFSAGRSPGEGLPVIVVDEEIYRQLPALLIATVDKFAQMPWNGVTQMLFGQVDGLCERHGFRSPDLDDADSHPKQGVLPAARTIPHGPVRPPDLIIQDELHLISGPLGSLVGLYETAVDYLSSWEVKGKRVRPKVVASTATIRNAKLQVHKTFRRRVSVFPPQGLDVEDNFFAVQSDLKVKPGRLYVGVCAPGRRLKSVLIRVYIAYMAAAQALFEKYGPDADPWMTTVGYFNSMRELGGMRRLVDDDVRSGLGHTDKRGLPKRRVRNVQELTSRMNSAEIPKILDNLEVLHTGERDARLPIDVLLATNMVSVGVDVKRLGLMIVANQPKSTAEYIQATSRVGRNYPGLVCTVLNWARPRDLSHYERFEHYHATFYQYVEALSVTPFAPRALDRGLSALLVATTRLAGKTFNSNASAASIQATHSLVSDAKAMIIQRAIEVEGNNAVGVRVKADLAARIDSWAARAQRMTGGAVLGYKTRNDGKTFGLLEQPGSKPWQEFTCLNSLRDVEASVNLILDNYGMDEEATAVDSPVLKTSAPMEASEEDELLQ